MTEALQVFVRGFEDTSRGNVIRDYLTQIGFDVESYFTGEADDLGGLIETNVVHEDGLEQTDPELILFSLRKRTGFDGLWLQTREFEVANDGEYGRDDEDESEEISDEQIKRKLIEMSQAGEPAPDPKSALGQLLAAYTNPNASVSPAKLAKLRAECFPPK